MITVPERHVLPFATWSTVAMKIAVAGSTGNLGMRIIRELVARGADVIALARTPDKRAALEQLGAAVAVVESVDDIARACTGAACVVSTLQGLRDAIIDAQMRLVEGAIAAGVPRFVPSDFSTDFTSLRPGDNRNFDVRRELAERIDQSAIAPTSIFNGAFAEILTYNIPLLDLAKGTVGYWEDADWAIDFTTMDDTAAFTAAAACDASTPRKLCIASFQISPRDLAAAASEVVGRPFALVDLGTRDQLRAYNQAQRAAHPEGEHEVFPVWQRSQYTHSMFSTHHAKLDNDRYDLHWTSVRDVLSALA
jgi:nucleoside-diphosphate-sugar epimerase